MNTKKYKLPILIIAIGLILAVVACLVTCIVKEPLVKEQDFPYSIVYRLDGEEKTFDGVFECRFQGNETQDINVRHYSGTHTRNGAELTDREFIVAQKDGIELQLVVWLDEGYLMGDPDIYEIEVGNEDPYLVAYDSDGMEVDVLEMFGAEIISWDYPEPIENSFQFAGFSVMSIGSMLAMMLAGVLTIIVCAIFVKKDPDIQYQVIDKLSAVFNFIIGLVGVPIITFLIVFMQIVVSGDEFMYQVYLCIPALSMFAIAASVALRRKGFPKFSWLVQFAFPILLFVEIVVESLIFNIFS